MTQIFLNYRAADEPFGVAMIDHSLSDHFGSDAVFLASKSLKLGSDWEREMFDAVAASTALLVIIGRHWSDATDKKGRRLLDRPRDFVRREILHAFDLNKKVIPVYLGTPRIPQHKLPPELAGLHRLQDIQLTFRNARIDTARLADKLREQIPELRRNTRKETATQNVSSPTLNNTGKIGNVMQGTEFTFGGDFNAGNWN